MTPQSKILLVFFLCLFIVAVVLFVVLRKKKEKRVKNLVRRGKENYPPVVNIWLDEFEEKISN